MDRSHWRALGAVAWLAVAALGSAPRTGNAMALLEGEILLGDFASDAVLRIDLSDQVTILSQLGYFFTPRGVAVDSNGFAYVTDSVSNTVTQVDPSKTDPDAQALVAFGIEFVGLRDIVVDSDAGQPIADRLLVIDPFQSAIFDVDTVNGRKLLAFDGASAVFPPPTDLCQWDPAFLFASGLAREATTGDLFIADPGVGMTGVYRWVRETNELVAISLSSSTEGNFLQIEDVAIQGDCPCEPLNAALPEDGCRGPIDENDPCSEACQLVVVDAAVPGIFRVDPCIEFACENPTANQELLDTSGAIPNLELPISIAVESNGNIVVSDPGVDAVFRFDSDGNWIAPTITDPDIAGPLGITVVPAIDPWPPSKFYVVDTDERKLYRVDPNAAASSDPELVSEDDQFRTPVGIALDAQGRVIVTDQGDGATDPRVIRVDPALPANANQTVISSGLLLRSPTGVVVDAVGRYLIADPEAGAVIRVRPGSSGAFQQEIVSTGNLLDRPIGVALDSDGILIVADESADDASGDLRGVVRVNPATGSQASFALTADYQQPVAIAIDTRGDYVVADRGAQTVFRVNPRSGAGTAQGAGTLMSDLQAITTDLNRDMLVSDAGAPGISDDGAVVRVEAVSKSEEIVPQAGTLLLPAGIAIDLAPVAPTLQDPDGDAWGDGDDNCRCDADPDQLDTNLDGVGNLCDQDYDNNGLVESTDRDILSDALGSVSGDPEYFAVLDANSDGAINGFEMCRMNLAIGGPPGPSGLCTGSSDACPVVTTACAVVNPCVVVVPSLSTAGRAVLIALMFIGVAASFRGRGSPGSGA